MSDTYSGVYAAYLTGKVAQGFAMLVFRRGVIVGAGPFGEVFDGEYKEVGEKILSVSVNIRIPSNVSLI